MPDLHVMEHRLLQPRPAIQIWSPLSPKNKMKGVMQTNGWRHRGLPLGLNNHDLSRFYSRTFGTCMDFKPLLLTYEVLKGQLHEKEAIMASYFPLSKCWFTRGSQTLKSRMGGSVFGPSSKERLPSHWWFRVAGPTHPGFVLQLQCNGGWIFFFEAVAGLGVMLWDLINRLETFLTVRHITWI